jgi:hypothetical protein
MIRARRRLVESHARGRLVAANLQGAWRRQPPSPTISAADLALVAPLVQQSGGGALGWWAIRGSPLRDEPGADLLHQTYRFDALGAAIHERELGELLSALNAAGIDPLLAKGWAAARLYPEPGLRPYDDFDLLVPHKQFDEARAILRDDANWGLVDLHQSFAELADRSVEELYAHSVTAPLQDLAVRVLGPEDHLRLLCQHLLRHGAWRTVWLCDVAAALESIPPHFDWDYCMRGDPRRGEWVRVCFGLAQQLLGATPARCVPTAPVTLPSWLTCTVLAEWGRNEPHHSPGPLKMIWQNHGQLALQELRRRWPNPLVATVFCHAAIKDTPRLPLQVANYVVSAVLAALGKTPATGG